MLSYHVVIDVDVVVVVDVVIVVVDGVVVSFIYSLVLRTFFQGQLESHP